MSTHENLRGAVAGRSGTYAARVGRKTGPKPRFTLDDAVDAALEIGVATFTLGDVARRLGVSTSALYRVVDSRDALVDLCLRRWIDSVRMPVAALSWQDQLRAFVDELWAAHVGNPGMIGVLMERPEAVRHVYRPLARLCRTLADAGLDGGPERVAFAVDFVADTVHMAYLGLQRYADIVPGEEGADAVLADRISADDRVAEDAASAVRSSDDEGRAVLRDFIEGVEARAEAIPGEQDWTYRTWLDRKVEFIIAGLEAGL